MKFTQIVEVLWNDIHDSGAEWTDIKKLKSHKVAPCFTVGYLVEETEEHVKVIGSYNTEKGKAAEFSGAVVIPRGAVTMLNYLEAKE